MLDRCHGRFKLLFAETLVRRTQMLHQKTKRNLLSDFERALDLVHGFDAGSTVGGRYVDGRRACTSPLVIGIQRGVH